ncbi:VPLPA-CTERM sorting domain-containing protein [uncultured Roseobacter sp.]|uniref:VPLPA-CTERM sorting domain-containing protein n=1 Tax=uncultured Roseobacter sp. TaxID=114847 RepID=UPI002604E420|nr:VPLPA-CTERM sorting domain-containing protein [uncultured Roseobacter sp.]
MIVRILKTIAALAAVLFASQATAASVVQVAGPADENNFAFARADLGLPDPDLTTGFDITFTIPTALTLLNVADAALPVDASFSSDTGGVFAFGSGNISPVPGPTVRILGSANTTFGIDVLDLIFSTTTAGTYSIGYSGFSEGFYNPVLVEISRLDFSGSFDIVVQGDPQAPIIPLPAGGLLLMTGLAVLGAGRKLKRR